MSQNWAQFTDLLLEAGLSKEDLAAKLGVSKGGVARWKVRGVPDYAIAYLELLRRNKQVEAALIIERERRP